MFEKAELIGSLPPFKLYLTFDGVLKIYDEMDEKVTWESTAYRKRIEALEKQSLANLPEAPTPDELTSEEVVLLIKESRRRGQEIDAHVQNIERLKAGIEERNAIILRLQDERDELKAELKNSEAQRKYLCGETSELQAELTDAEYRYENMSKALDDAQAENEALKADNDELRQHNAKDFLELKAELRSERVERQRAIGKLSKAQEKIKRVRGVAEDAIRGDYLITSSDVLDAIGE